MNAIGSIPLLAAGMRQLHSIFPQTQRVFEFAVQHFQLLQNIGVFSYGGKEIIFDRVWSPPSPTHEISPSSWCHKIFTFILLAQEQPREFYTLHGSLMIGSGAFGVGYALFGIGLFTALSEGLFILAAVLAARYNIEMLRTAKTQLDKASAILGILSSLGYILTSALVLMEASASIALVIGCLSITLGGLKILLEYRSLCLCSRSG